MIKANGTQQGVFAPLWRVTEIDFESDADYANPYADAEVTATFRGPGGETIRRPAFWDGGKTWKVRFAPPMPGTWHWSCHCSHAQDAGLHGRAGTLQAVAVETNLPLYRHGFLRVSGNGRHFVHADGTPFFWLGDTHWQMPDRERVDACNHPEHAGGACPHGGQFQHLLANRLARGFNVYQTYPNATSAHWWAEPFSRVDPVRFRDVFDVQMDRLAESGMVIALGCGHFNNSTKIPETDLCRFARYLVARYGAHPVVWITCQEMNAPVDLGGVESNRPAAWKAVAEEIARADGYRHPHSAHQWVLDVDVDPLGQEPWHSWFALQGGHRNSGLTPQSRYRGYYDYRPTRPVLETEAMYERVDCGGVNSTDEARQSAWKALLCGSPGYTYGGAGIWFIKWDAADPGCAQYNHAIGSWHEGMNLPGAAQMTALKLFFTSFDWTALTPRFDDPAWAEWDDPEHCVLATIGHRLYLAYCYGDSSEGTLKGLDPAADHVAAWINPRTGEETVIGRSIRSRADGSWPVPAKSSGDWLLWIRPKHDRGAGRQILNEARTPDFGNLHVATNGDDAWSGTLPEPDATRTDGPLATLARAQALVRDRKHTGPVTVTVKGGEYPLAEPLAFTAADSGTAQAPIVYRAADGERVHLSGGVRITDWRPVTDPEVLDRLPQEARGHVVQADLRAHGVSDFGAMDSGQGIAMKGWSHSDAGLEVFFRDRPMTLARYPNEGYLRIASLSVEDGYDVRGTRGSRTGRFRVEGEAERLRRWADEPGAMLHGYWFWDWADQRLSVRQIEPETGEITLDETNLHHYGYRVGQWFYAFNLLCELDQPGEWYLDRETGLLYFWPPDSRKPGEVTVSVLRDPVTFEDCSHITLRGFTIEVARGTAIQISGGEAVRIAGCTLRNIGSEAVHVTGGARHCVSDCDIYQAGDGGIYLEGGDRRTLTPGGHEAVNNHLHHIARWNPLYKVGIQLKGCGNRAAHNRLHDLPHVAIGFTGNDQVVEFNEIYQSVTGANDAGAIYTSGSHPEDWSMRGHVVRFNYLHHLFGHAGEGCNGIYLDDMFSGTEIHGNVLWRVAQGFLLGGGRDIISTNNVFIDCPQAISLDARAIGWAAPYLGDVFTAFETMPYRQEPWASRYPELVDLLDDEPAVPKGNVIARNIVRGGRGIWVEDGAKPGLRMEDNLEQEDPHFADAIKADWRLREDSPALALGFVPLPLEEIGLQVGPLRPSLPPRRLFEAEAVVQTPPVLLDGQPLRPGAISVRVRNLGDTADSATIRLRVRGGRLGEAEPLVATLAPFAVAEQRFTVWGETDKVHLEVVQEGVDGVLDGRTVDVVQEGAKTGALN